MEFRLIYRGQLFATQRDPERGQVDRRAGHKHAIRRALNPQLRRLWEITPFLVAGESGGPEVLVASNVHTLARKAETLAEKFSQFGFNFVPLVTQDLNLICGLEILFLRPDKPGEVVSGDVDNRLKTFFDALSIPNAHERYVDRTPGDDERPIYCLLENDRLITKLTVETDQLLDVTTNDRSEVALIVTVRLRPYEPHWGRCRCGHDEDCHDASHYTGGSRRCQHRDCSCEDYRD